MKPSRGIRILLTITFSGAFIGSVFVNGGFAAEAEPQLVRKKIVVTATPAPPKAGGVAVMQPKSAVAQTRKVAAPPEKTGAAAPQSDIRPKSEIAAKPGPNAASATEVAGKETQRTEATAINTLAAKETPAVPKTAGDNVEPQKAAPSTDSKTDSTKLAMATASEKPGLPPPYDPKDKIDPFEPLFKEEPEMPQIASNRPKRIPRTPLEKIALTQLKLVGIITASSGNRALVQEASGKGYIIKKGTYIGTNAGKVVEIDKEKVVVEEEYTDIVGNLQLRKKELLLPKPSGE